MSNKKVKLKDIVDLIEKISANLGIHPHQLTKAKFLKEAEDEVTEWNLRSNGGLTAIIKANFPLEDKDIAKIQEQKEISRYINKLEKELGNQKLFQEKIEKMITKNLKPVKIVKPYVAKKNKLKDTREVNALLSDMHYGSLINGDEIGDVNNFAWAEASRRTALFVKQVCDYKLDKRDEVKQLNLFINGDVIQGVLRELQMRHHDLLVYQTNGAIHILTHAIMTLAKNFKKVKVIMTPGNHDNAVHKRSGGKRQLVETFDSYINIVYFAVSAIFKDQKNVEFDIPKTHYAFHDSIGGRMMVTHGDVQFSSSLGNPHKSLNIESLTREIDKFNSGEVAKGKEPVKIVMFGHVHKEISFRTETGVQVLMNNSLSGTDGFAHSLTVNHNGASQTVFETTKDFIFGDSRNIQLLDADKDASLDKIIPVYNQQLKWT